MNKIYIKISDSRLWILDYNFVCAIIFIPITAYSSVKLIKKRVAKLERERRIREFEKLKELEKLYRILEVAGSSASWPLLLKILELRGGQQIVIPGVADCVDLEGPSYIDSERILRILNDRFAKLALNGIVYLTNEAFCYLVATDGLVDLPITFLERIKVDGIYSFISTSGRWASVSLAIILVSAGNCPYLTLMALTMVYLWFRSIALLLTPSVTPVHKITGKYIPRIPTRKDGIVFDANQQPLPPLIEQSIEPVKITTIDTEYKITEYEITEKKLLDVAKASKLKNKFSDIRLKRLEKSKKKAGKTVYFLDKLREWANEDLTDNDDEVTIIDLVDKMLKDDSLFLKNF